MQKGDQVLRKARTLKRVEHRITIISLLDIYLTLLSLPDIFAMNQHKEREFYHVPIC